jgi:uncharacterized membrane protein
MALNPSFTQSLSNYLSQFTFKTLDFVVALLIVLIFLAIGYFVAKIVNMFVFKALERIKLEEWIKRKGLQNALAGFSLTSLILILIKIYIVFAFLGAAAEVINVTFFTQVISALLAYLPSLVQGLAIIIATLFIAAYITNTIRSKKDLFLSEQLAFGVQVLIAYIALILALPLLLPNLGSQIKVLIDLLNLIVTALIIAFGLGVGLALGLGLKDSISEAARKHQDIFDNFFAKFGKKK